ncbi:unnamed protein product [Lactuca saligna]|uniref:Uncharacterized protein n=1 Tax=Lactuca saligna TaxID=75948 RepID=A0AA35YX93_LACSI|nr:unnamed protein product [Lactuca saligna]
MVNQLKYGPIPVLKALNSDWHVIKAKQYHIQYLSLLSKYTGVSQKFWVEVEAELVNTTEAAKDTRKIRFNGVLGEALDLVARWSRDVITVEKVVLEQSNSQYELQGEYVLPRSRAGKETGKGNLLRREMAGHLGSVISFMGR